MSARLLQLFTLGIATVGLSAAYLAPKQAHEEKGETPMEVSKLPAAVQATAKKVFGKLDGLKASQEKMEGSLLFEVEGKGADGMDVSFTCPDNGQIYELERGVAISALPGDASTKIMAMFPGATGVTASSVETHYFEVTLQKDGKTQHAIVGVSGRIYQEEGEEGEEGEEDEEGEGR